MKIFEFLKKNFLVVFSLLFVKFTKKYNFTMWRNCIVLLLLGAVIQNVDSESSENSGNSENWKDECFKKISDGC